MTIKNTRFALNIPQIKRIEIDAPNHPNERKYIARLTEENINQIQKLLDARQYSNGLIAKLFNVSEGTVSRIRNGTRTNRQKDLNRLRYNYQLKKEKRRKMREERRPKSVSRRPKKNTVEINDLTRKEYLKKLQSNHIFEGELK